MGLADTAGALGAVAPGWLCLGLALHFGNQLARGRGWWSVLRAAHPGGAGVRRREAIAAWIAGAGVAGVLTAQAGGALRVWLLGRRAPEAGYPLLAGTLVAEAAGALVAGVPVLAIGLAAGLGPAIAPSWHMGAGLVAAALAAAAASWAVRRRARGWRVLARVRDGCAPLARPRAYARAVSPWQCLSRACEIAAWACFLGAFHLPVSVATVLLVVLAQAGGRVLTFAPAALGAMVAVLSVTFARVAHTAVDPGRLAVFVVGTTGVLTATGAALAALIVLRERSLTQAQRSANPLRSALAARWLHDQTVSPEAETA